MVRRSLLLSVLLLSVGCSGKVVSSDVRAPKDTLGHDAVSPDTAAPDAAGDAKQPGDATSRPDSSGVEDGMNGPCGQWSAWSCEEDDVLLCKASCAAGPLQLSCINTGDCVCGVAGGPCGKFEADNPCGVCQKAVEAACCWQ